jgi:hypothetical protein
MTLHYLADVSTPGRLELRYATLDEARANGQADVIAECVERGLRPLGPPQIVGREGYAIVACDVEEPRSVTYVINVNPTLHSRDAIQDAVVAASERALSRGLRVAAEDAIEDRFAKAAALAAVAAQSGEDAAVTSPSDPPDAA